MNRRVVGLVAASVCAAAGLLVAACSTSGGGPAPSARVEAPRELSPSPIASMERGGLAYDNAPDFDLERVLRQGGQGVQGGILGDASGMPSWTPAPAGVDMTPVLSASPGEELWVIIQPDRLPPPMPYAMYTDDAPGCGALMYEQPGHPEPLPFPLEHTAVEAQINGYVASVNVSQRFYNPSSDAIEAVYVFPLPHDAAINGFLMTIDNRTIRGVIRPREQAERIYEAARAQGHTASLLTQERANIFTQHVANIAPGRAVEVDITYFHTLACVDGWFEYVFPMVVGPRFNPQVARGYDPRNPSDRPVVAPVLPPGERSGHDISIDVTINAGMAVEQIACNSHRIGVRERSEHLWDVRLDPSDSIPNKDFVLRYRVAGEVTRGGLIVQRDPTDPSGDGWFTLLLVPPARAESLQRAPVEFVFVIDTSGSMQGQPLVLAVAAVDDALRRLLPGDTFQIIRFSEGVSSLGRHPLPVDDFSLRSARAYLSNLAAGGGTQMLDGIKAALDYRHDPRRQRYVVFLTDGFIGNENEILGAMHDRIGPSRVFSFGIGTSPNRLLLDEMARVGRGAVAYLAPTDNGPAVMSAFFERVARPAMTNVEIDFGGLHAVDVFPRQVPDLYAGRPVVVTGRFTGDAERLRGRPITVRGWTGGLEHGEPARVRVELAIGVEALGDAGEQAGTRGLREVWARAMIREMENQARRDGRARRDEIERTALRHNLMSTFTSFVAVDSSTRAGGGEWGRTVEQPGEMPGGMGSMSEGGGADR